ncbi:MAG: sulfite exporter TauE/SafE family protein [Gammaproteobacteria bacterium]|nr:sulfite exporter TauE/SafE family protein [Rhodocyclaceae bacterium]MBU3910381.1 sulfite exporter TauE/SafE family protein [Gammaproteobacteria bacterium]MBU3989511.1 sulfite exporter TauE/SafE family protein [Gammaproteobacteria bacterium]MBU4004862.1 sulfite exporter TauE/SafE family protein [Gammaproteobacteria bacterium]MBU4020455.1 sulfite exporter TauE/SafE family protein [Gammaproteobacteria bacterium]
MPDNSLLALFIVGLLGGGHCAGMCGGIVAALSLQGAQGKASVTLHLAYNAGRIASYVLAGLLVGAVGYVAGNLLPLQRGLYAFASLMLVALGFYLLGATQALAIVEKGGQTIWAKIQPFTGRFLPVRGVTQALPLGFLWGWLPCGLVYSALTTALASASAWDGALLMLAFGLGTLPNLLLAGLLLSRFRRFAQARTTRVISGLLVLGYGLYGLANLWRA